MHRVTTLSAVLLALVMGLLTAGPSRANPDFDLGPPINAKAPDIATGRIPPRCCFFALFRGLRKHCTTLQSKTVDSVLRVPYEAF